MLENLIIVLKNLIKCVGESHQVRRWRISISLLKNPIKPVGNLTQCTDVASLGKYSYALVKCSSFDEIFAFGTHLVPRNSKCHHEIRHYKIPTG